MTVFTDPWFWFLEGINAGVFIMGMIYLKWRHRNDPPDYSDPEEGIYHY